MARATNTKTQRVQRTLREAGFKLVRNPGGHEIWRKSAWVVRLPAGHRQVEANVLSAVRRVVAAATQTERRSRRAR